MNDRIKHAARVAIPPLPPQHNRGSRQLRIGRYRYYAMNRYGRWQAELLERVTGHREAGYPAHYRAVRSWPDAYRSMRACHEAIWAMHAREHGVDDLIAYVRRRCWNREPTPAELGLPDSSPKIEWPEEWAKVEGFPTHDSAAVPGDPLNRTWADLDAALKPQGSSVADCVERMQGANDNDAEGKS